MSAVEVAFVLLINLATFVVTFWLTYNYTISSVRPKVDSLVEKHNSLVMAHYHLIDRVEAITPQWHKSGQKPPAGVPPVRAKLIQLVPPKE